MISLVIDNCLHLDKVLTARIISTQHVAILLRERVTNVWPPYSNILNGVGSSLKMVKFLLQYFWILQDDARLWPALSQHLEYKMLRLKVAFKCCVRFWAICIR